MKIRLNYRLKSLSIMFLVIYLSLTISLFFLQKSMLYFPSKVDFFLCENFLEDQKKIYKNTRFYEISGIQNNIVLFFHGNAGSACDRVLILNILKQTENNIIFMEYSGYSQENNNPNKKDILNNALELGEYVENKGYDNVYVMGRSLGTGIASYFARDFRVEKLLLISPYDKLYKVAQSKYPIFPVKLLFTQNYNSDEYLENYKNDLLVIHGKKDNVIPYKNGLDLYNTLINNRKELITLPNSNHHNVFNTIEVRNQIIDFFKTK